MAAKKISQREARRLRKLVCQLQQELSQAKNVWTRDYPGGVNIATVRLNSIDYAKLLTAKKIGCALVVTTWRDDEISVHAIL